MKTVILTSSKFAGEVELRYNQSNMLWYFENRSDMDSTAQAWLITNMPIHTADITHFIDRTKTLKVTEIRKEISFEDFWNKYDNKAVSSKKKALTRWKNMSKVQRYKAYYYISIYLSALPQGVSRKYAETYLNSEIWEK